MPARSSFDYAILRIVPRVEREELINAGVILFCLERDFLAARIAVDEARLRALWPRLQEEEVERIRRHLEAVPRICSGGPDAGPIGKLSQRERFRWLVAPRSTMIQVSPVHSGLAASPQAALDEIFARVVLS